MVFTPPKDEITKAKKILEEFNNSNTGLVVIDGKLIEKPVLREMKRKILIADKVADVILFLWKKFKLRKCQFNRKEIRL